MVHELPSWRGSRSYPAVLAGGVMIGVAFPPIGFWPLAWGAMIPLFLAVARLPSDRAFLHGLAFFLPALGIPFHWVALHRMTVPALVSTAAVAAVAVCAAAVIALFAGRGGARQGGTRIIAAACSLLLFEQILIHGPVPFPSAVLGYSMADAVWLDPVLRAAGVSGVSLLLAGTAAVAAVWLVGRPARRARHVQALFVLVAFVAGWVSGPLTPPVTRSGPGPHPSAPPADVLRMTLVQPALEPHAWADVIGPDRIAALERRLDGLLGLIDVSDRGIVVLPETALPAPALSATGTSAHEWMTRQSSRLQTPLLVGAITAADDSLSRARSVLSSRTGAYRNSALLASPEDVRIQRYDKQILVPFAERVPMVDVLPFLGALSVPAGGVTRYVPGRNASVMSVDGARLGLLICFESLFPQLARRHLKDGADLLVVLTQDGWWTSNAVRRQHLLFSRMRAVETGLPLVQVSVDGESGVFDHRGRLRVLLPTGIPAAQTVDVPLASIPTLFGATGHLPLHIFIALILAASTVQLFAGGAALPSSDPGR